MIIFATLLTGCRDKVEKKSPITTTYKETWSAPDTSEIPQTEEGNLIKYGRTLVINTAAFFGPKGSIAHVSNGMNCQNCHLNAGTKPFGNNFSLVATGYPRYKDRSASVETFVKKINDCFERSLDGKKIDTSSREMKAFVAYVKWVGKGVAKGSKPYGSGIEELSFSKTAADTAIGHKVYMLQCAKCHGNTGQGVLDANGIAYVYPPLWGSHSYNIGASIYRISKFAGYVKNNMPFGINHDSSVLSVADAWNVAAFVNAQPHPYKNLAKDWPKAGTKPYDYPFGPYTDGFSETQHKYGPFDPIKKALQKQNSSKQKTAFKS